MIGFFFPFSLFWFSFSLFARERPPRGGFLQRAGSALNAHLFKKKLSLSFSTLGNVLGGASRGGGGHLKSESAG